MVVLSLSSNLAKAAVGCAVGNIMYLDKAGSNYKWNGAQSSLNPGCSWAFTTPSTSCSVNGGVGSGFLADTVQECPIDDEVWLMLVGISGVSYFSFRKKLKLQL